MLFAGDDVAGTLGWLSLQFSCGQDPDHRLPAKSLCAALCDDLSFPVDHHHEYPFCEHLASCDFEPGGVGVLLHPHFTEDLCGFGLFDGFLFKAKKHTFQCYACLISDLGRQLIEAL